MLVTEMQTAPDSHKLKHDFAHDDKNNQALGDYNSYRVSSDEVRNRYSYDARSFEQIELNNGKLLNIARPSATDLEQPLHMEMTGTPKKITDWMRYILAGAMMRQLFKATGEIVHNFDGFPEDGNLIGRFVNSALDLLGDKTNINNKIDSIESLFNNAITDNLPNLSSLRNNEDYKEVIKTIQSIGKNRNPDKFLEEVYSEFKDITDGLGKNLAKKHIVDEIGDGLKKNQGGKIFDTGLGAITSAITVGYAWNVRGEMMRCFAEAIAYEDKQYNERKKPSEINIIDLFTSDNKIIQETCHNYIGKNILRSVVSLSFFGRWLGDAAGEKFPWFKNISFGEINLGALGILMATEMLRKDSSIFDDIVEMRDHKLNPQKGIAASIDGSDLFDLYQKYCIKNAPDKIFKDATRNDYGDEGRWESARVIFDRMAEMMNHTYKYKDTNVNKDDPVAQIEQEITSRIEYFTLPKFIYLLGHDMVDFDKPELTLACAEIANTYSVQAAKQFYNMVTLEQVPLADALEHYVVDLRKTLGRVNPEIDKVSDVAPIYKNGILENFLIKNPDIHEKYDELIEIRDAIKREGKTPALINKSNIIIEDVKSLLNQRQSHINGDEVETKNNIGTPDKSVNNIVKFERMANELLAGANRNF